MKSISTLFLASIASILMLVFAIAQMAHTQPVTEAIFSVPGVEPLGSGGGGIALPTDSLLEEERQAIETAVNKQLDLFIIRLPSQSNRMPLVVVNAAP